MTKAEPFTVVEVREAQRWLSDLGAEWKAEIPRRIHESGHDAHYGLGSSPPFAPEFIGYIGHLECLQPGCRECIEERQKVARMNTRHTESRTRTTKAFRKLRKAAPLEFDVLYMAVMHNQTVAGITIKLNQRAESRGLEDRYTQADVAILALSGYDKLKRWW